MSYDPTYELRQFRRWRTERVLEVAQDLGPLLLAIGSRESNLRNIVGGGYFDDAGKFVVTGEDRGVWQINENSHRAWLDSIPGCASGAWEEVYDSALPKGRVPGLTRGAKKAASIIRYNLSYARSAGVHEGEIRLVAVCGYNAGVGTAVKAYRTGDPNRVTTNGDYGNDVLYRERLIRGWLTRHSWGP